MQNGTSGLPIPTNQIPEVTYSSKAGSSKQSRKIHRCDTCGYESLYSTHMRRHQLVHSRNFWQCHLCPLHFSEKHQLDLHLQAHRGQLRCNRCGISCVSLSVLKRHRSLSQCARQKQALTSTQQTK